MGKQIDGRISSLEGDDDGLEGFAWPSDAVLCARVAGLIAGGPLPGDRYQAEITISAAACVIRGVSAGAIPGIIPRQASVADLLASFLVGARCEPLYFGDAPVKGPTPPIWRSFEKAILALERELGPPVEIQDDGDSGLWGI